MVAASVAMIADSDSSGGSGVLPGHHDFPSFLSAVGRDFTYVPSPHVGQDGGVSPIRVVNPGGEVWGADADEHLAWIPKFVEGCGPCAGRGVGQGEIVDYGLPFSISR